MGDWAHSRRLGTPADEAGYVVLRQPPASKLANLFKIDISQVEWPGAALRSWQAGAVQFTAKICGLVGRATMADPPSAGGAFRRLAGNKLPGPRSWRHQPDAPARRPAASRAGLSQRPSLARRVGMAGLLCPGIDAIARNRSILG